MRDAAGQNAQALEALGVAQFLLGALLRGDVDADARQPVRLPGAVRISPASSEHPAGFAAGVEIAEFDFKTALFMCGAGEGSLHRMAVVGMDEIEKRLGGAGERARKKAE